MTGAFFSPDGTRVVTTSWDKTARIREADTGKVIAVFNGHSDVVQSAAFSRDGRRIVTGSGDMTARVGIGEGLRLCPENDRVSRRLRHVAFNRDGSRVITGSLDKKVRLWDATIGKAVGVLEEPGAILGAVFISDGWQIITAWGSRGDRKLHLWFAAPNTQELIDEAREVAPRCLGRDQRERFSESLKPADVVHREDEMAVPYPGLERLAAV